MEAGGEQVELKFVYLKIIMIKCLVAVALSKKMLVLLHVGSLSLSFSRLRTSWSGVPLAQENDV